MKAQVLKVVEVQDHPNADSLKVYQMVADILHANNETVHNNDINFQHVPKIQIVANLENVYNVGDHTKVVLDGAVLKDGTKIKETKIRGVVSKGMALGVTDLEVGTDLTEELCQEDLKIEEETLDKSVPFVKWPSIESFHNVRRYLRASNGEKKITFHGKCKLHGSNAGVSVKDGAFRCQKRSSLISVQSDNMGFCAFCHREDRKKFFESIKGEMVIFGEWCGKNIQKGVAVSQIPNKSFCIFAIQYPDGKIDISPTSIEKTLGQLPEDVYVLPYCGDSVTVDFTSPSQMEQAVAHINREVALVEEEDPWVKKMFNISGIGEGLVFYPISECEITNDAKALIDRTVFSELVFKAKGKKHSVVSSAKKTPIQIDPEILPTIKAFVDMFVTENRLNQIAADFGFDVKKTGPFLGAFMKDVSKECLAELEASNLTWKQVSKDVGARARLWYIGKCNELD